MRSVNSSISAGLLSLAAVLLIIAAACGGEPQDVDVSVTIRNERMSPETIQVKHNDTVTLKIDSDIPGAVHLHGYDIEHEVTPGEVTDFAFTADATGRFRIAFHKAGSGHSHGDSSDGHGHGESSDGHGHGESSDGHGEDESSDGHGHGESSDGHGHDSVSEDRIESEVPVSVRIGATVKPGGNVQVFITTENWSWAPDDVDSDHVPGSGHAHIYVDGEKIDRVFGPTYVLTGLSPGVREVRVTLNANSHNELLVDGEPVEDTVMVTVQDASQVVEAEVEIGFLEVHPR